jgi:hypothetical protein
MSSLPQLGEFLRCPFASALRLVPMPYDAIGMRPGWPGTEKSHGSPSPLKWEKQWRVMQLCRCNPILKTDMLKTWEILPGHTEAYLRKLENGTPRLMVSSGFSYCFSQSFFGLGVCKYLGQWPLPILHFANLNDLIKSSRPIEARKDSVGNSVENPTFPLIHVQSLQSMLCS